MDTSNEQTHLFSISTLAKAAEWVVKVSSLFLLTGFIFSSIVNQLVFRAWGMDFFLLAGPADVLMSGMSFISATLIAMVIAVVPLAAFLLILRLVERPSPQGKIEWLNEIRDWIPGLNPLIASFIFGVVAITGLVPTNNKADVVGGGGLVGLIAASIIVSIGFFFIAPRPTRLALGLAFAGIALNAIIIVLGVREMVNTRATEGYFGRPTAVYLESLCENGGGKLLWMGSEHAVAKCLPKLDAARRVAFKRDAITRIEVNSAAEIECRKRRNWIRRCRYGDKQVPSFGHQSSPSAQLSEPVETTPPVLPSPEATPSRDAT